MSFSFFLRSRREHVRVLLVSSRLARGTILASVCFVIAMVALVLWRIMPLAGVEPYVPLHYNVYFGIDQFGPWWNALMLPLLAAVFTGLNVALAALYHPREPLLVSFLLGAVLAVNVFLTAGVFLILLLNV